MEEIEDEELHVDPSVLLSRVGFQATADGHIRRAKWQIVNEDRWTLYQSLRALVLHCMETACEQIHEQKASSNARSAKTSALTDDEERYYLALFGVPVRLGKHQLTEDTEVERRTLGRSKRKHRNKQKRKRRKKQRTLDQQQVENAGNVETPVTFVAKGDVSPSDGEESEQPEVCSSKPSDQEEVEGEQKLLEANTINPQQVPDEKTPVWSVQWTPELATAFSQTTCPHIKYWKQRYLYFPWFDEGALFDREGWYSVTPQSIALHLAARCTSTFVIDFFCGNGGSTIAMAQASDHVLAVDIDEGRIHRAQHNAKKAKAADKIEFICSDVMNLNLRLRADIVFMSPPWGGMDYSQVERFNLDGMTPSFRQMLSSAFRIADNVAILLPANTHTDDIRKYANEFCVSRVEIEEHHLNGGCKSIAVYFGTVFGYENM